MKKRPLFTKKSCFSGLHQQHWTITMMFKQTFSHFSHFILYHIPQLAQLVVFLLFFQFEIFYLYDHYAVSCVPLPH